MTTCPGGTCHRQASAKLQMNRYPTQVPKQAVDIYRIRQIVPGKRTGSQDREVRTFHPVSSVSSVHYRPARSPSFHILRFIASDMSGLHYPIPPKPSTRFHFPTFELSKALTAEAIPSLDAH